MSKRPYYIAFSLVVLLVLILFSLPSHTTTQLKLAIGSFFLPLFGLSSAAEDTAESARNAVIPRNVLTKQLRELQDENQRLQLKLMQAETAMLENDRLRAALNWPGRRQWKLRLAKVVGRDPANWRSVIHINVGSRDGLQLNQPVLVNEGLVGRVATVGFDRSQVALVGDPNCHVSVIVENSGESGIIGPSEAATLDPKLVDLSYVTESQGLSPGQRLITSGLGGVFPKGIPVGVIVHSRTVDFGLYTAARVKLSANLDKLEEVWVLSP